MQELIEQLKSEAGLTEEQATKAVEIVKGFVMSKVPPMFSGAIEGFFANGNLPGTDGLI